MSFVETCQAASKSLMQRATSRKFIVFCIATHMTYTGVLVGEQWIMLAMLYTGAQTYLDRNGTSV